MVTMTMTIDQTDLTATWHNATCSGLVAESICRVKHYRQHKAATFADGLRGALWRWKIWKLNIFHPNWEIANDRVLAQMVQPFQSHLEAETVAPMAEIWSYWMEYDWTNHCPCPLLWSSSEGAEVELSNPLDYPIRDRTCWRSNKNTSKQPLTLNWFNILLCVVVSSLRHASSQESFQHGFPPRWILRLGSLLLLIKKGLGGSNNPVT